MPEENHSPQVPFVRRHRLLLSLIITLAVWLLHIVGTLQHAENITWNWRLQINAEDEVVNDDIVMIHLDQQSLDWAEKELDLSWPWPRETYAAIIDFCKRQNAKALALDVTFTEKSQYESDDEVFGESLKNYGRCTLPLVLNNTGGDTDRWLPAFPPSPPVFEKYPKAKIYQAATRSPKPIEENTKIFGFVQPDPESDQVYRSVNVYANFDHKIIPLLGFSCFLSGENVMPKIEKYGKKVGPYKIPLNKKGRVTLNYKGKSQTSFKSYSAAAVIQSALNAREGRKGPINDHNAFTGKYVFFGFTATSLHDQHTTPLGGKSPGVHVHAVFLDNLLNNRFIIPLNEIFITLGMFLMSLLAVVISDITVSVWKNLLYILVIVNVPIFSSFAVLNFNISQPLIAPILCIFISFVTVISLKYITEGRQKHFIRHAFRHYLSPAVIEELLHNPHQLRLGGERRELTMFFSDLQNFTSLSETLNPEELVKILNDYLSEMAMIIEEEGGTIDKYEGDAIIAFWNAPVQMEDHAFLATRAALRCQAKLAELRPKFNEMTGRDLYMRIGLNTGDAVVGNMGSHKRFDYTMMGDAVNLASRLEGCNKQFGTYTMISEATLAQLNKKFGYRELGKIAVVGRKEAVTVFEPMTIEQYHQREKVLDRFHDGLVAFYNGRFREAVDLLEPIIPQDPAAKSYVQKCKKLIEKPPADWHGVWQMTEK